MNNIAVFPGSFDPFTLGHLDIVNRAVPLFDRIVIAIGVNSQKSTMYSAEKRKTWITNIFAHQPKITVEIYEGLTVDFCRSVNAGFILRGLRSPSDFSFEAPVAQMNKKLNDKTETVFLITSPEYSAISSTIVRDIIRNKGDVSGFIPTEINPYE